MVVHDLSSVSLRCKRVLVIELRCDFFQLMSQQFYSCEKFDLMTCAWCGGSVPQESLDHCEQLLKTRRVALNKRHRFDIVGKGVSAEDPLKNAFKAALDELKK